MNLRRYAKFIAALLGAVLVIGNQLLPLVHGTAQHVVTEAIAVAAALGVYLAPYVPADGGDGKHELK